VLLYSLDYKQALHFLPAYGGPILAKTIYGNCRMKVGDLVKLAYSVGLIVEVTESSTLVQWLDNGVIEDVGRLWWGNEEVVISGARN